MSEVSDELSLSELEDGYLKVLLLMATRRATSSEPRRAGFWHGLAGVLGAEQEKRQAAAALGRDEVDELQPRDLVELAAVVDELRRDLDAIETEYQSSYVHRPSAGTDPPS